ncbi:MAG: hypothetical protein AB7V14_03445 [Kiritimatiellia bacterium]
MLLIVQASLWAFYALVPWLALNRWLARDPWPVQWALAVLAGTASQAVLSLVWSLGIRQPARGEGGGYLVFWLIAALVFWLKKPPAAGGSPEKLSLWEHAGLAATLLAGFAVRLVHPLRCWALGQSDAYSHLSMFRDVAATGSLGNALYPPGYAWTMSMPAAVLGVDPYHVARFGGAFFGMAMVLGVYFFLGEGCRDRRAALAGAFLAACFPGFMLLHKTGVGAFANQAGLFFLPMVFGGALAAGVRERRRRGIGVGAGALAGMLISVPMMGLHVILVVLLFWICGGCNGKWMFPPWLRRHAWVPVLVLVVALAALVRLGSGTLAVTTAVLTTADETVAANFHRETIDGLTSLILLSRDFFSVKRWGVGNPLVDAAFAGLAFVFAGLAAAGIRRKNAGLILLGGWGGLAAVQTATGFLQFTAYQREGWSLLMAAACLGGLVAAGLGARFRFLRPAIAGALAFSAAATLWRPPAHNLTNSTAEETLVRIARMFSTYPILPPDADPAVEGFRTFLSEHLIEGAQFSFISRPLLQEFMLPAVCGPKNILSFSGSGIWRVYDLWMETSTQAVVFLDKPGDADVKRLGPFAAVSPVGAHSFIQQQAKSYALNGDLEAYVLRLPTNRWRVARCDVAPELRAYYVSNRPKPARAESPAP